MLSTSVFYIITACDKISIKIGWPLAINFGPNLTCSARSHETLSTFSFQSSKLNRKASRPATQWHKNKKQLTSIFYSSYLTFNTIKPLPDEVGKVSKKWCKFCLGLRDPGTVDPTYVCHVTYNIKRWSFAEREKILKIQKFSKIYSQ